jgi:hypothetical protein
VCFPGQKALAYQQKICGGKHITGNAERDILHADEKIVFTNGVQQHITF